MRKITLILLLFTACQSDIKDKSSEPIKVKEVEKNQSFSKDFYKCEKLKGATTTGISSCLEEELKREDKKLNIAYKKAKATIQPFRINSLKKVQLAWIKYRNVKCNFFNHKESGTSGSLDEQECRIKETIVRTKELENIF